MKTDSPVFQYSFKVATKDGLILGLIMLIFYVFALGSGALHVPDEGRYSSVALAMLQNHDYVSTLLNGAPFMDKPVLFYWLEAVSMWLFGVNEWAIRLPMVCVGVFGIVLTQQVACLFYGRRAGWLSGLILGTSILYYISSHYADMDLEVGVWISASLFFSFVGLQYPLGKRRRFLFYMAYFFAAAGVLTKGLMGIAFPVMVLGLYSVFTRQWSLIKTIYLPTGFLLFIILCAPWFILMQREHPDFFQFFFIYQQFTRFLASDFNSGAPFWLYIPIVFLGLFPWSLFIPRAFKCAFKSPLKDHPDFYLALWVIVIFIFFSIPNSKPVTYIIPIFPALAVLIGHQIDNWLKSNGKCHTSSVLSLIMFCGGVVCLMAGYSVVIKTSAAFHLLFIASGFILIISAIITAVLASKRQRKGLVINAALSLMAMLICLAIFSENFNKMSTKTLSVLIKNKITPTTKIINFNQYFYDLPIYLQMKQPIIVVDDWTQHKNILAGDNWRRELYFGMQSMPEAKNWLIQPDALKDVLKKYPSYLFARTNDKKYLLSHYNLKVLAETDKVVLFTNNNTVMAE